MIHIHPFPARMAPEIALSRLQHLPTNFRVLDPMTGSGMVLGTAAKLGLKAVGYDLDPLSCLISKVNGTWVNKEKLRSACAELVSKCAQLSPDSITLPWIDDDDETQRFIAYWFAPKQIEQLRKLSFFLVEEPFTKNSSVVNALQVAVSRLVVTKEPKASLARDTAHSRPHRTINDNEFDVIEAIPKSLEHVLSALSPDTILEDACTYRGDARKLGRIASNSIDCIVTSPPYLNAIDYMRGHKLSLVWFGYNVAKLRNIRSRSVGAEIRRSKRMAPVLEHFLENLHSDVDRHKRQMLQNYYYDLLSITAEANRVLKSGRQATYVIGNSHIRGHEINNCSLLISAAKQNSLHVVKHLARQIPESRRYLPLLNSSEKSLSKRIKTEHIITFVKKA